MLEKVISTLPVFGLKPRQVNPIGRAVVPVIRVGSQQD